jgi:hypothetical protein
MTVISSDTLGLLHKAWRTRVSPTVHWMQLLPDSSVRLCSACAPLHSIARPILSSLSPSFSMDNTGVQYVRASPRWSSIFCVAGLLRGMKTDQRRTRTKSVVSEDGLYGAFFEFFFLKPIILKF